MAAVQYAPASEDDLNVASLPPDGGAANPDCGFAARQELPSGCSVKFRIARDPRGIWLPTLDAFRTLAA
jgi:hypothetical protein